MAILRSLLFYVMFYPVSAFFALTAALTLPLGREVMVRSPHAWARFHNWCVRHVLGIKIRFEGHQPEGPVMFVLKHESYFDAIELPNFIPFPAVFAKEELFDLPFWGRAALVYGLIPVYRQEGASALRLMRKEALARAAEGRSLALFPEGTRVPHGTAPPLRSGFAGIYKLVKLPVVPVAIDSGPLYHRLWKKRGTITIRFGEIIPPGLNRAEAEAQVHAAINALNPASAIAAAREDGA